MSEQTADKRAENQRSPGPKGPGLLSCSLSDNRLGCYPRGHMTKRVAIYTRLSRYRGADDPSTSPERQRDSCTHYALAKGWEIVRVLEDLDVSGSEKGQRLDRPGLQAIRRAWDEIDVVVVPKLDRLARSVVDFHLFYKEAQEHGVDLVFVHEGLDLTTSTGRFVASILAAFAQMESETIGERTRAGRAGAASQLRWGGPAPYGYRLEPHPSGRGKTLALEPAEADALRQAATMICDGQPLSDVSRWMTEHAPKPRRAAAWSSTPLRQMLTGETVLGRLVVNGRVAAVDVFPAIFTPGEASKVRAVLSRSRQGERADRGTRLLSGLLVCSGCGGRLMARSADNKYLCGARGLGRVCPRPVVVSAPAVEQHVTDEFLAEAGDLPLFERQTVSDPSAEFDAVGDAIGDALAAVAQSATPELFDRLRHLQAERDRLAALPLARRVELTATGKTVADAWADADVAGRRRMLGEHYRPMVLNPGVRGKHGFDPARLELEPQSWYPPALS